MAVGQNPGTLVNIPKAFKIDYLGRVFSSPKRYLRFRPTANMKLSLVPRSALQASWLTHVSLQLLPHRNRLSRGPKCLKTNGFWCFFVVFLLFFLCFVGFCSCFFVIFRCFSDLDSDSDSGFESKRLPSARVFLFKRLKWQDVHYRQPCRLTTSKIITKIKHQTPW